MLSIHCTYDSYREKATATATALGCELFYSEPPNSEDKGKSSLKDESQTPYQLTYTKNGVALYSSDKKQKPISVDWYTGAAEHRRKFGGGKGQMIAKAVGLHQANSLKVLDATAGLGGDAFVLASLGCTVTLQERSPIAYALLEDGLERARQYAIDAQDNELSNILQRMALTHCNSAHQIFEGVDVVYLDPMFPERKKKAAVNKGMKAFHSLIGSDDDADELLTHALQQPIKRVVVKRPRIAPNLQDLADGRLPHYTLEGKSSRFDIYALQTLKQ